MEIEMYETESGKNPVGDFIERQPPKAKSRIMKNIDHLQEKGLALLSNKRKLEKITGKKHLYELKIPTSQVTYRILCQIEENTAW